MFRGLRKCIVPIIKKKNAYKSDAFLEFMTCFYEFCYLLYSNSINLLP